MATVTVDQMKEKLLTTDQVRERLATTEPLSTEHIDGGSKILFKLDAGWEQTLDSTSGTEPVQAVMRINGVDHPITKDAALQAAATIAHVPVALIKTTPANLLEPILNYHFSAGLLNEHKVLMVDNTVAAFTRPTVVPFSNLSLLDNALAGIAQRYGSAEVLADYKVSHSLQETNIRLIVPEHERTMQHTGMVDVPTGQADVWSAGVHLSNSLIGKKQTAVEAYLFRWWCTNGCTTTLDEAGVWSRRANLNAPEEDIYDWARGAVDDVLGGLEHRFDQIQALTELNVSGGNTADILREVFTQYEVPVSQRDQIRDILLGSENLTMYVLMQAITQVANDPNVTPQRADRLMRIGGDIPTAVFDTLKARVWREGHLAEAEAPNPYEIQTV